jgi:AraC-like DNA-binding protein
MTSAPTNLASLTRGILRWGEKQGLDRHLLLRATALDARVLDGSEGRLPASAHQQIWIETGRLLGDPDFGLRRAASIVDVSSFGVVGLLTMTSANVGESIERAVKYARVLREDLATRCYVTDLTLVVEIKTRPDAPRALVDCSLAAYWHFMQEWTGESIRVREVFFQHERPSAPSAYELFECPVHFGHPTNAIVFDREVTAIALRTAQPAVAAYMEGIARATAERLALLSARSADLPTSIRSAVREAVETGDARIAKVARRMGMSTRTLQRALAQHGLLFRRVVDEARWELAAPLVTQSDAPIDRIAEQLGYAEAKAFRRAFRRWSGVSPSDMRRAYRAGGSG